MRILRIQLSLLSYFIFPTHTMEPLPYILVYFKYIHTHAEFYSMMNEACEEDGKASVTRKLSTKR